MGELPVASRSHSLPRSGSPRRAAAAGMAPSLPCAGVWRRAREAHVRGCCGRSPDPDRAPLLLGGCGPHPAAAGRIAPGASRRVPGLAGRRGGGELAPGTPAAGPAHRGPPPGGHGSPAGGSRAGSGGALARAVAGSAPGTLRSESRRPVQPALQPAGPGRRAASASRPLSARSTPTRCSRTRSLRPPIRSSRSSATWNCCARWGSKRLLPGLAFPSPSARGVSRSGCSGHRGPGWPCTRASRRWEPSSAGPPSAMRWWPASSGRTTGLGSS